MLALRAFEQSEFLSAEERYFWMATYDQREMFGEEYDTRLLDEESQLSNTNAEQLRLLIEQWNSNNVSHREHTINELLTLS